MKRFFHVFGLLMTANVVLMSCLNSDETEVILHNDAAISTFTLGTFTRYYHPTSNPDTTMKTTVTGSYYKMTIDHLGQQIYNADSLPLGTQPRVLCTITTMNSGIVGLKGMGTDTLYSYFNSSDSVDFSEPRMFRVVSSDGTYHRDYQVTVNIAKTTGDVFTWHLQNDVLTMPTTADGYCLAVLKGKPVVLANDNTQSVVAADTLVYQLSGGNVYRSEDGQTWTLTATAPAIRQLVGTATREVFAIGTNDSLMVSRDGGVTWKKDSMDSRAALLPQSQMACVRFNYPSADSTDYVLFAGAPALATDTLSTLWRKISFYTEDASKSKWVYMPHDDDNYYMLPRMEGLQLAYYDKRILAVGKEGNVYLSPDQGITWRKNSVYALPEALTGQVAAMTTDKDGRVWLVTTTGQLWIGYV